MRWLRRSSASFTLYATEPARVVFSIGGAVVGEEPTELATVDGVCGSTQEHVARATLRNLAAGPQLLHIVPFDVAGNEGEALTYTWDVIEVSEGCPPGEGANMAGCQGSPLEPLRVRRVRSEDAPREQPLSNEGGRGCMI